MAKSGTYHHGSVRRRKCPKRCTLTIYHTGLVILFAGIVVATIGIATSRLFHVYIYDHRKPARFLNVHIPVGLFSVTAKITWLSLEQETLPYDLEITDGRWISAQATVTLGLLFAIASFILHLILSFRRRYQNWVPVMFEVCGLLLSVIAILIGLSLAESEIEYIHDHGDAMLTNFLSVNQLLTSSTQAESPLDLSSIAAAVKDVADSKGDFALFLTSPQLSFALLIASDFLILVAFLAVLIYFVHLCEKAVQARKQMRTAELSHG